MAVDSAITSRQLDELRRRYRVHGPDAVMCFLRSHPGVIAVLDAAPSHIATVFADAVDGLSLRVQSDPEEDYEALVLTISCDASASEALSMLDALDEAWLLHVDPRISDIVVVTVAVS